MLSGFESRVVDASETTIFIRRRGSGRPVLLLHGFPQTHLMWHRVAPALAEELTVVCADLRGYGASGKPPSDPEHTPFSKRVMALDMVEVMEAEGFSRFSVVGHDRGARVAYRMALDHPDRVERLVLADIVPTSDAFAHADARFALAFWPWSLLAQPAPLPERLIQADPEIIVDSALSTWGPEDHGTPPEIRAAYVDALRDAEAVHAICEEYRAAATLDAADDREDRDRRRRITCPTLVLWSEGGGLDTWYDDAGGPLGIWRHWASDVTGRALAGGHFFPEQNAAATLAELLSFFRRN